MQISFAIAASMLLATAMVSSASGPPLMVWPASTPDSQINDEFDDHGRDLFAESQRNDGDSSKSKIERELQRGCSAGQVRPPGGSAFGRRAWIPVPESHRTASRYASAPIHQDRRFEVSVTA